MERQADTTISRRSVLRGCAGGLVIANSNAANTQNNSTTGGKASSNNSSTTSSSLDESGGEGEGSLLQGVETGTWIGFIGTLFGSFGLLYLRRQHRRSSLRTALIGELKHLDRITEVSEALQSKHEDSLDEKISASEIPPAGVFPTSVYESNLGSVGLLKEEEVNQVVSFYSTLISCKSIIQAINDGGDLPMADHTELYDNIIKLDENWEDLIKQLGGDIEEDRGNTDTAE